MFEHSGLEHHVNLCLECSEGQLKILSRGVTCSDAYFIIIIGNMVCLASRDDVRGCNGEKRMCIHSIKR